MFDTQKWFIWQYEATITNTKDAGQNVSILITPGTGNKLILLFGQTGPDDYGAGRTFIYTIHEGDNDAQIAQLCEGTLTNDNVRINFPYLTDSAPDSSDTPISNSMCIIAGTDYIRIFAGSLADNEVVTLVVRALVLNKPTVTTNPTAEVTHTEVYSRLI